MLAALLVVEERVHDLSVAVDECNHRCVDALVHSVVDPLGSSGLAHLDEHETVAQVRLDAIAKTLDGEVGSAEHNAALGHVVVANAALVDDRSKHVLDELRSLGDLVEEYKDRLGTIDAELVDLADTEALVGQLTRDAVLTVEVRHPHRTIGQLSAVNGIDCDVLTELGVLLERMEQRGLTDTVLALDDDGALVANSGDEVQDLSERKHFVHD